MKKSLMITLLLVVGAAVVPWTAVAEDCQYHRFKMDNRTLVLIDTIGPYDRCREAKVIGTLSGRYWYCFFWDDFMTSDFIYGDGFDRIFTGYFHPGVARNEKAGRKGRP